MEKKFIKDGKIAGNVVVINGRTIINPSEEILLENGYKEYTPSYEKAYTQRHSTNEDIRKMREYEYKNRSDSLYMAYQKYLALGETEKAENARRDWILEVERIDREFPYNDEGNS